MARWQMTPESILKVTYFVTILVYPCLVNSSTLPFHFNGLDIQARLLPG